MAAVRRKSSQPRNKAKTAPRSHEAVRDRFRELTLAAFRDRKLGLGDIPDLVRELLAGAAEGLNNSIPVSNKNVLREVFDGVREGVVAFASAGEAVVRDAGMRGRAIAGPGTRAAAQHIRAANAEFLEAVSGFAERASKQMRDGLNDLVAQARKTAPKVAASTRKATNAADGRLLELTEEAARAGIRAARGAAGALAMGTGGFFEGLAALIAPEKRPNVTRKSPAPKNSARAKKVKRRAATSKATTASPET